MMEAGNASRKADRCSCTRYIPARRHLHSFKGQTMTGTTRSSHDLDPRRRRALVRSWRRGTREMDLVLGGFADAQIDRLTESEMDEYETILAVSDTELFRWVTGEAQIPQEYDTPLFARILASRGS
ncbi:hypothetical protein NA8A_02895 [Nitratireductor indicus C115]|uniref:FAD assembly factor SdhE n=2 Tax=Nitratireductor indicus TaxID=721133 RepID=K2NWN6_9HYPH|nr:hypothetical protein NA8A_02895 [Nitratireductor indicus C115]